MSVNNTRQAEITGRAMIATAALAIVMVAATGALAQPSRHRLDLMPQEEVLRVIDTIRGGTIIVDWHGTWDYETIEEALDAAEDGDTIIVLPSTGSPDGAYVGNLYFPAKAVTLRSLNPEDPEIVAATVIDGNASGTVVLFGYGYVAERDQLLDGFTITNGVGLHYGWAGGVHCTGSPTVARCVIEGNTAEDGGGAGGFGCDWGSPLVRQCTIRNNTSPNSAGGAACYDSSPEFIDCTFNQNTCESSYYHSGGGAYCSRSNAVFRGCRFVGNQSRWYGAGVKLSHSAGGDPTSATLVNCSFIGNQPGGLENDGGALLAANCIFRGNMHPQAGSGVGITTRNTPDSDVLLVNCSITDNGDPGWGLIADSSVPHLVNCLFWGNSGDGAGAEIHYSGDAPVVSHSCIEGGWPGEGNTDLEPLFVDRDGADGIQGTEDDDLRPRAPSPCLDAGLNGALPADIADIDGDGDTDEPLPWDLDGQPRVHDDIVDMGAYEGAKLTFEIVGDPVAVGEGLIPGRDAGERGVGAFLVRMSEDPMGPVEATVSHIGGDGDLAVYMGEALYFDSTNYGIFQPVILNASEDADWIDGWATFAVSAPGAYPTTVAAFEEDDEPVPDVVFVDMLADGHNSGTSWGDAFTELRDALRAIHARPGTSQILVATGIYAPAPAAGDRHATFELASGVGMYGGFPSGGSEWEHRNPELYQAILTGDLNQDDDTLGTDENSFNVVTCSVCDDMTVLDGFVIEGGNADGLFSLSGAGMRVHDSNPAIVDCKFQGNRVSNGASFDRGLGGALYSGDSSPLLVGCDFAGNTLEIGKGGIAAAFVGTGDPVLVDCTFTENNGSAYEGGTAYVNVNGTAAFAQCRFVDNQVWASGGAILTSAGVLRVANCLLSNNWAETASAIGAYDAGEVYVSDCTVARNEDFFGQAALEFWGDVTAHVANSIVWANESVIGGGEGIDGNNVVVEYSNVQNGWTGEGAGNISVDPHFVNPDEGDYRLLADSPCIDAASNDLVPADELDLDEDGDREEPIPFDLRGNPRFVDCPWMPDTGQGAAPIVDMGAYEKPARRVTGVLDAVKLSGAPIEVERIHK
ncbi:MAG: right-handed parallel beta-helix repeat-containing protein [Phycisphaerae bacterium]|nr:right-handed parallel beta-helix repeat-containing protein [Phycisphaerae bacterium]